MHSYHAYLKLLIGAFLGTCAAIAVFNYAVDPFEALRDHPEANHYGIRPHATENTRIQKISGIIRRKPDVVFFGSSVINNGMDIYKPEVKEAVADYPGAYDAAVGGGTIKDSIRLFKHALANNPRLSTAVFGIDWINFTWQDGSGEDIAGYKLEDLYGRRHLPLKVWFQLLLGRNTLEASYSTLSNARFAVKKRLQPLWQWLGMKEEESRSCAPPPLYANSNPEDTMALAFTEWELSRWQVQKDDRRRFFQPEALEGLRELVTLAKKERVKLIFVVNANPGNRWVAVQEAEIYGWYEDLMRRLVQIAPVLDFSAYAPFYGPPPRGKPNFFNGDNLHYPGVTGAYILRKTLSGDVGDVEVTQENLERRLAQHRVAIAKWRADNPRFTKALQLQLSPGNKDRIPERVPEFPPRSVEMYQWHAIYFYMGNYYALPVNQAPFDLIDLRLGKYTGIIKAESLDEVKKRIDEKTKR